MSSKAEKKRNRTRARNRAISLPGGESAQPVKAQGRPPSEDPMKTVLRARIIQLTAKGVAKPEDHARGELAGCQVGIALLADAIKPDERESLWAAVCHMRRVWLAYDRACGAPSRHAQCLRILTPSEHFGTTGDAPAYDERPPEERDRAAISAYMRAQGWLMQGDNAARSACVSAVIDDAPIYDWPAVKRGLHMVVAGRSRASA